MLTNDAGDGSRARRGWFESILTRLGDGIIAVDREGRVDFMNPAAETLTGWTQEEAAGQPLAAVFQNFDLETRERCESPLATALRSVATLGVGRSTMLVARDLTERPIEQSAAPIRNASTRNGTSSCVFFSICRDDRTPTQ